MQALLSKAKKMNFSARSGLRHAFRTASLACAALLPLLAAAEMNTYSFIGPGVRSRPAYDGSNARQTEFIPAVRYFGRTWFVRSTEGVLEGGARMELMPGLVAGAQLAYEAGRQASDSDFLQRRNIADIKRGASIGVHMEWDHQFGPLPVTLLGRVRHNIDSDLGNQADLRLTVGVYDGGRVRAGIYGQTIWGDAKATGAYYGISPQQASASGLPAFQPGSGWLNTSLGAVWAVDLSEKWIALGTLERRRLSGDAARSPLTERRSGNYFSAGLAYRL
jgi:MipA family protein